MEYLPVHGTVCISAHITMFPWAPENVGVVQRTREGPEPWQSYGFMVDSTGRGFAVAPNGRSFCGVENAGGPDHTASELFCVYHAEQYRFYDVTAGELGTDAESVVSVSWAPDSSALVVELAGDQSDGKAAFSRLIIIDATTGKARPLHCQEDACDPVWLGTHED